MNPEQSSLTEAIGLLQLGDQARILRNRTEAEAVVQQLVTAFLTREAPAFWWEHLRVASESRPLRDGYKLLPDLVPDPDRPCWLVAGLDSPSKVVVECTPNIAARLLGECPPFEYALADKTLEWMVMETHHDVVVAVGSSIDLLRGLRS